MSVLSAASTASHLLPPTEWLREKALEYCQRLLEQSGRRESWACPTCPHRGSPQMQAPWPLLTRRCRWDAETRRLSSLPQEP